MRGELATKSEKCQIPTRFTEKVPKTQLIHQDQAIQNKLRQHTSLHVNFHTQRLNPKAKSNNFSPKKKAEFFFLH